MNWLLFLFALFSINSWGATGALCTHYGIKPFYFHDQAPKYLDALLSPAKPYTDERKSWLIDQAETAIKIAGDPFPVSYLEILLQDDFTEPFALRDSQLVVLAARDIDQNLPVPFLHELGHVLFNSRAKNESWFLKWYQQASLDIISEKVALLKLWGAEAMQKRPMPIQEKLISAIDHIVTPYTELFADLIASIATNNPSAFKDHAYSQLENQYGLSRQIITEKDTDTLVFRTFTDFDVEKAEKIIETQPENFLHNALSGARPYIWNQLLKKRNSVPVDEAQKIVDLIYRASISEIRARLIRPQLWDLPVTTIRKRFVKRLQKLHNQAPEEL